MPFRRLGECRNLRTLAACHDNSRHPLRRIEPSLRDMFTWTPTNTDNFRWITTTSIIERI